MIIGLQHRFILRIPRVESETGFESQVFLTKYYPDGRLDGEVVQVLGDEDTPGLDITTVVLASGIRTSLTTKSRRN